MSNSNKDNKKGQSDPDLSSLTWGELGKLEEAAEAGGIKAQKRLAKIKGSKRYKELFERIPKMSSKLFKRVTTSLSYEIDPILLKGIAEAGIPLSREITGAYKSLTALEKYSVVPNADEQLRIEISESIRVNREILEEMRKQRRQKIAAQKSQSAEEMQNPTTLTSNSDQLPVQKNVTPPWKKFVPDRVDDWRMLELWDNNHTNSEIGARLQKAPRTITNRISSLRLRYPHAGIPTNKERRKLLQKP